jgi:hypothetical protein
MSYLRTRGTIEIKNSAPDAKCATDAKYAQMDTSTAASRKIYTYGNSRVNKLW